MNSLAKPSPLVRSCIVAFAATFAILTAGVCPLAGLTQMPRLSGTGTSHLLVPILLKMVCLQLLPWSNFVPILCSCASALCRPLVYNLAALLLCGTFYAPLDLRQLQTSGAFMGDGQNNACRTSLTSCLAL